MSSETLRAPTTAVLAACDQVDMAIEGFISAKSKLLPTPYEADGEALNLFNLVIRHAEGVLALARADLVLVPPAYATARAAFEAATRAAWMVNADDPFDREARWLVHLQEEERARQRASERATDAESAARFAQHARTIKEFREGVTDAMPKHVKLLAAVPNLLEMSRSIGGEHLYLLYIFLSQFAHGGHMATSLYRQNLGTEKKLGEFVMPSNWYIALRLCWLSLYEPGNIVLSRVSGSPVRFLTPTQEHAVQSAIEATTIPPMRELH
jgi:hypothetical protein